MIAAQHNLVIEQQTSFLKVFQWLNKSNAAIDLTGYDTELEIRDLNGSIIDTYSTANARCTNGSDGKMTFSVGAEVVENYKIEKGVYSLKVFKQTGSAIVEAGAWTSTNFDVDDGSGRGSLTADGATPFSTLAVGDYISLAVTTSGSAHSGIYKIEEQSNTVLTLATILEGVDSNQSTDVSIYKLDTVNFYRLVEGEIEFSKESARIPFAN